MTHSRAVTADKDVDAVINLTIHQAHVETTTKCLEAGASTFTPKNRWPSTLIDAKKLVQLANSRKRCG